MNDPVSDDDRRKASFLAEYRETCLKYRMMVVVLEREETNWQDDNKDIEEVHALFDLAACPEALETVITEMLIGDVCYYRDG